MLFKKFSLNPKAFFALVILPSLSESFGGTVNGLLGDFSVMDDIKGSSESILDATRKRNILQRYGNNCKISYSVVGQYDNRKIEVSELYAAAAECFDSYYNKCLVKYAVQNQRKEFQDMITKFFYDALVMDLFTNLWVGNVTNAPLAGYSVNKLNGVVSFINGYIASGRIPASQNLTIPTSPTPIQAHDALLAAYNARPSEMKALLPSEQCFWVSQSFYDEYEAYVSALGGAFNVGIVTDVQKKLMFKGIEIKVMPIWDALATASGAPGANQLILSIKGNFIFGTDKDYNNPSNPVEKEALKIWYDEDSMMWKWRLFMKAGCQLASPEFTVISRGA